MKDILILLIILFSFSYAQASGPCEGPKVKYVKKDGIVYYHEIGPTCNGCEGSRKEYVLDGIHEETFKTLADNRSKTRRREELINRPAVTCSYRYGKDKNNVYFLGKKVLGLDPKGFVLDEGFNIDLYELKSMKVKYYFYPEDERIYDYINYILYLFYILILIAIFWFGIRALKDRFKGKAI